MKKNTIINMSLDNAITTTYAMRGSIAKINSVSWYRDHPEKILDAKIISLTDALAHSKTERTYIVYFRVIKKTDENNNQYYELDSLGRAKVGKGYFEMVMRHETLVQAAQTAYWKLGRL